MSFVRTRIDMPRQTPPLPAHLFRDCAKCRESRPPEGGIQMSESRWMCAVCWTKRMTGARR
jgi:hypothetical protein